MPDEAIQGIPYFRFCQTIDAIYRRINEEREFCIAIQEISVKFIASIIASTAPFLKEQGVAMLSKKIGEFSILKKPIKNNKKELPIGGYEQAISFFSGMEK